MRHRYGRREFVGTTARIAAGSAVAWPAALDAAAALAAAADADQQKAVETFFRRFYEAKDKLDAPTFASMVADPNIYNDATLSGHCGAPATRKAFEDRFAGIFKRFSGPGRFSTFVHATGDMRYGAMVEYVDVAGSIFEVDADILTVMELKDGLVSRDTDYWDSYQLSQADVSEGGPATRTGVALPLAPVHPGGTPRMAKPCEPQAIPGDTAHASPEMRAFIVKLGGLMAAGDSQKAAALFTDDAVLIHPLVHQGPPGYPGFARANQVKGRRAIQALLKAGLPLFPDGLHATVVNAIGGPSGGGYEWKAGGPFAQLGLTREGIRGATALDLTRGRIRRMSVKFDTMQMTADQQAAARQATQAAQARS